MAKAGADEDAELVGRAQAGDFSAFDELVGRHERRMYGLALGILRQREDAEDAVQRAFLSVVEHIRDFRGDSAFRTWLTRIVTNNALEVLRKRRGLPTVPFEEAPPPAAGGEPGFPRPEFVADWRDNPERLAARAETRALLDGAMDSLDPGHRAVFLLRDVEGFSIAETAQALGLTGANVKVRLLRARLRLREELTAAFGDPATRVELPPPGGHHHA